MGQVDKMKNALTRTVTVTGSSQEKIVGERKSFADYLSFSNIILLGDPGAGKTHILKAAADAEGVANCTVRNFLACPGVSDRQGTVYLDGLDEYRSRSDDKHLIIELVRMLHEQGNSKIRLSCRSADWRGDSDLTLFKQFFENSSFVILNLEPLVEKEIIQILNNKEIPDPEGFRIRAEALNLTSLLGNPQTLIMLADVVRNGAWPVTRKDLFEKSCNLLLEEHNTEHTRDGQGTFTSSELIEPAGAISAILLISGTLAVSLLPGSSGNSEYPSYKTINSQGEEKLQACLMRRCFSFVDIEREAVTYMHRTVAEFLGAQWLATKIRAGYPFSRALSLMGKDGFPTSELRGMYAWLPIFLPEYAAICLQNDPYGVLMYGDAAILSPSLRKCLLENLEHLFHSDPWFRADNWSHGQLGALSGEDMMDSFKDILLNSDSFHLRNLILEAIANGPELPDMREILLDIVVSGKNYQEAVLAVEALLQVVPGGDEKLIEIFHSILVNDLQTARLRGKMIALLYENNFQPKDVLSVCHDVLHDTNQHAIGELRGMIATLPETALPDILDSLCALNTGENFDGEKVNKHIIGHVFERILLRLLQTDFSPQSQRLWEWLTTLSFLNGRHGTDSNDIASWLKKNSSMVFDMLLQAIEKVENEQYRQFWYDFEKITMRSLVGENLIRMVFIQLREKADLFNSDHALYDKCGSLLFRFESDYRLELFESSQALAEQHPSLAQVCKASCQCEIEDWHSRRLEIGVEQREKEDKQKEKTQQCPEQTRDTVETGEDLHNIALLAEIYFGLFDGGHRFLTPVDRLCESIGREYVDMALSGFTSILNRDNLPTPHEVVLFLLESDFCLLWWLAVLAGINEVWLRKAKSFESFSDDLLKSALAIATKLPVNSVGDKDLEWLPQLLEERQDIVEFVYEEIAQTELEHNKNNISVLYSLQRSKETKKWRSKVALRLLKKFPCARVSDLKDLVFTGIYDPDYRDVLLKQTKDSVVSCHGEQREIWLLLGFLLDPIWFAEPLKKYSKRHDTVVWLLRDFCQDAVLKETDKPLQFSVSQLECCIFIVGRAFGNTSKPDSITVGDQNPWDAAEFVCDNINLLATEPASESTEALKRLLANDDLSSYHDHLRHSLANQAVIRREAEYCQPSWIETIESLKGGKPANIADLHALIVDQLLSLQREIQYTNTDPYKAFWRCDPHGRVETPEVENICRNRLIDLLKPSLLPLDLHIEPEGHMVAEKRADILIMGSDGMKVPIELKQDFHKDLWTAWENQLERMYAQDPGAAGYGIYGVFWFGDKRPRRMKKPPVEIIMPPSAKGLEQALQSLVPPDQQKKIRVMVFDVTSPY